MWDISASPGQPRRRVLISADLQPVWNKGQRTQSHARRIEDGICDGGSQTDHRALARTRRWKIPAIEQNGLQNRNILEAWHAIFRHPAIQNLTVLEFDRFEKRATPSLNVRAFDLIAQIVGIHNCAALKGGNHANHLHVPRLAIHLNLGEGRNVTQFLVPAAHPKSLAGSLALPPAKLL